MKRFLLIPVFIFLSIASIYSQTSEMYWPQGIISGQDTILVYQPQVESWNNNILQGRSAVQFSSPGKEPAFGIIVFSARTETNTPENYADLNDVNIQQYNFPTLADNGQSISGQISTQLSEQGRMSLEQIKSSLAINQAVSSQQIDVKNDPPKIFYSSQPAVLIQIDGDPVAKPIAGTTSWERIINSSAFILYSPTKKVYEVSLFGKWFNTTSLNNQWMINRQADTGRDKLLASALQADTSIQTFNPPAEEIGHLLAQGLYPKIIASTEPSELLITSGQPEYEPLTGTSLLYVKNTSADMFKYVGDGMTYVLISGRWFKASNVNSAWTFVAPDQLPVDFKNIPETHPKGSALVSVAGTPQAQEAAISSQIPQTATIDRQTATMQSSYDGNPDFQNIQGTSMQYAANSQTPIVLANGMYYAVYNGVWYSSPTPNGPWVVSVSVPPSIYTIPPSSPIHYVTYVRVYGYTPTVAYVGYTPGYYGCYMNNYGTVVYGTGWRYRPWVGRRWYGNPYSYGFGVGFNWNTWAGWSMSFGYGSRYYPVCRPWWGPVAYGPHRPYYVNHRQINIYNYNRSNVVINRNNGPRFQNNNYAHRNNYYAGRDGNVYRNNNGNWQMNRGNGWEASHQPQQVDKDHQGRREANNRVQMQQNYNNVNNQTYNNPNNQNNNHNNNIAPGNQNNGQNHNMYQRPAMGNNSFNNSYNGGENHNGGGGGGGFHGGGGGHGGGGRGGRR